MFKIEKNVPIKDRIGAARYPFRKMEVGDSFAASGETVRSAAYQYGKRTGQKFTTRRDGDKWRVWRTV